jgi:hypothetical protein
MYRYQRLPRGWSLTETQANVFGKIPVIYYTIKEPIWSIVQPLIDRMEVLISNQADANDYFASPMVTSGQASAWSMRVPPLPLPEW